MTPPVRLSVSLVVATAAACVVPGVGPVAASVLPHVAIVALVMVVGSASGWLTGAPGRCGAGGRPVGRVESPRVSGACSWLPSAPTGTLGLLDGLHPWAVVVVYLVVIDVAVSVSHAWMHRDARLWPIHEVHHHPTVWQPTLYGRGAHTGGRSQCCRRGCRWMATRSATAPRCGCSGWCSRCRGIWPTCRGGSRWGRWPTSSSRRSTTPSIDSADPRHHDRNFGGVTTLADLLMGTACWDFGAVREYGTGDVPAWDADRPTVAAAVRAWWGGLWHPVRRWFCMKSPQIPAPELRDVRG